jgi:release factor glutamine methyltransferase
MTVDSAVRRLARAGCVHAAEEASILVGAAGTAEQFEAMVARRAAGEPLEYVVGWSDFRGIRLAVDEGVFVPRARSGFLVEEAASLVRCISGPGRPVVVVDLCCGVGAIGVALATEVPEVDLHAADIDPRAVACAERNLAAVGGVVHRGDLFAALPRRLRRRTDVVVASPPYVPTAEIRLLPPEAREFESAAALDGGDDGFELVRRIARGARQWLSAQGCLALEVAETQVEPVADILEELGYPTRAVTSQEYGSAVVIGRCPRGHRR